MRLASVQSYESCDDDHDFDVHVEPVSEMPAYWKATANAQKMYKAKEDAKKVATTTASGAVMGLSGFRHELTANGKKLLPSLEQKRQPDYRCVMNCQREKMEELTNYRCVMGGLAIPREGGEIVRQ